MPSICETQPDSDECAVCTIDPTQSFCTVGGTPICEIQPDGDACMICGTTNSFDFCYVQESTQNAGPVQEEIEIMKIQVNLQVIETGMIMMIGILFIFLNIKKWLTY